MENNDLKKIKPDPKSPLNLELSKVKREDGGTRLLCVNIIAVIMSIVALVLALFRQRF